MQQLPTKREIEFEIEVQPSTTNIHESPYRMTLTKLHELKMSTTRIDRLEIY